jgi:hypothetical protein
VSFIILAAGVFRTINLSSFKQKWMPISLHLYFDCRKAATAHDIPGR